MEWQPEDPEGDAWKQQQIEDVEIVTWQFSGGSILELYSFEDRSHILCGRISGRPLHKVCETSDELLEFLEEYKLLEVLTVRA